MLATEHFELDMSYLPINNGINKLPSAVNLCAAAASWLASQSLHLKVSHIPKCTDVF